MKNFLLTALLIISTAALAGAPATPPPGAPHQGTTAQGEPAVAYAGGVAGVPPQGAPGMAPAGAPGRPLNAQAGPANVNQILELTPDQEKQLEGAQAENQKVMVPLQQERAKLFKELLAATSDAGAADSTLKKKINALNGNKKAMLAQQDKYGASLNKILSVRQQARLAVLLENQAMRRNPAGGPGQPSAGVQQGSPRIHVNPAPAAGNPGGPAPSAGPSGN